MRRKHRRYAKAVVPQLNNITHPLVDWMRMTEDTVMNHFEKLPNAERVIAGDAQYVFVPGTRDDRVLLVAHCDTVPGDGVDPYVDNGIIKSSKPGVGIGADDRAGCALLWTMKGLGHSLLIVNGEETGCKGSNLAVQDDKFCKTIAQHAFALELDRRGSDDLVYYNVGSPMFEKWLGGQMPAYTKAEGSVTDICVLCPGRICGVNISVGFHMEHTSREILVCVQWLKTLHAVKRMLKGRYIPKFNAPEERVSYQTTVRSRTDCSIVCPRCQGLMMAFERGQDSLGCIYCKTA